MYEDLILLLLLRGKTGIIKFKAGLLNSMILIFRPSGNVRRLNGALQLLIQNTEPHMCLPLPKNKPKIVRKENVETLMHCLESWLKLFLKNIFYLKIY